MQVSRIHRLLKLITLLQSRRNYDARDLADELGVSRRTVFRDLNMLELAQIPFYFDPDAGGYRISRHFFLPPINLTLPEALAMLTLAGRLRGAGQLPLISHGARAAVKLESALPGPIRQHVGSIIQRLSVSLGPVSEMTGTDEGFEDLTHAIAARRVCRIEYRSFHEGRQIETDIHPLRLMFIGRAWYVLAWSRRHRENRTFNFGRIARLTVTDRTFEPAGELDVEEYFGDAWRMIPEGTLYDVHLHFEPMVAGNVAEVRWHRTQRVQHNPDGSIEFHARVDGLGEVTWWILGYGDQVEVVAPPELRQRVVEVHRRVLAKYDRKGQ